MNNIVSISAAHLKSNYYHFPEGWVNACLEWLFEEHKDDRNNMSNDKWCHLIEQQWLFTDLRDLETVSSLGKISNDLMKFSGIICCQVMSFRVVNKSYYSQVRELTGTVNENASISAEADQFNTQNTSSHRSLLLSLTDGVNSFEAFEFEVWKSIEISSITVGCKCRLKGPFIIIRKVALLKKENIELLGGEVEDLLSITQLSIVEDKLQQNTGKRKTNSKTIKSEQKIPKIERNKNQNSKKTLNSLPDTKHSLVKVETVHPHIEQENLISQTSKSISNVNTHKNNNLTNETGDIFHSPINVSLGNHNNLLSTSEASQLSLNDWIKNSRSGNSNQINIPVSANDFDDEGEEFLLNMSLDDFTINKIDNNDPVKTENQSFLKKPEELNKEIEIKQNSKTQSIVDKNEPFVYLIDVFNELSNPDASDIQDKQFKIKGLIFSFASKLKIVEDERKLYRWDLQVVLGDGTATVDCLLDDDFITKKIGFTAQHFQEMKKSKSIDNYKKSFTDFQSYIVKCNCGLFTLQVSESYEKLCVVDYTPVDDETVTALENRIKQLIKQ